MRIWLINHYAAPKSGSSGTRHAVFAERLQQRGHEVTIFAAAIQHLGGAAAKEIAVPTATLFIDKQLENVRWRYIRVPTYSNSISRLRNMWSFGRNLLHATQGLSPPDIIIGSTVHPYAVNAALSLCRTYRVPMIYEIRDIWPESLCDLGVLPKWNPLYWHLRLLERQAFRAANGVIVLFPGMAAYGKKHGIENDHLCYLPNGIAPELYPALSNPPDNGSFVISFFGAHGAANGLETALRAASLLQKNESGQGIRLQLVGEGTHKSALRSHAQQLSLANVDFLSSVSKSELAFLAQQSHAFLFCLRRMPVIEKYGMSPNKLFEYLMWERPVISSCNSYNDPIREAAAGMSVAAEDPRALADAILSIRKMPPAQRQEMGRRGRYYALTHHNLDALAKTLESFLVKVVEEKRFVQKKFKAA